MNFIKLTDLNLSNKRVLIRTDFNVPIQNGLIKSLDRIHASLPTINFALKNNAYVFIISHFGRPEEGKYEEKFSLYPVVNYLKNILPFKVKLVKNYLNGIHNFFKNELMILENVRFNIGELSNSKILAKKYGSLCDVFVMDAFATSHRVETSTYGIGEFTFISCAGLLLCKELNSLNKIMNNYQRPVVAIIGGSKISTKITLLESLAKFVDYLIIGGGIANNFISALGYNIGKSFCENEFIIIAKKLLSHRNIIIPIDVRVSDKFLGSSTVIQKDINNVKENEYILDIGDLTISYYNNIIKKAKTILWNGPIGVFEFDNSRTGTKMISKAIANSNSFSVVGGGETIAAIKMFNMYKSISYISTGGGAFLKFIENQKLPVIDMLQKSKYLFLKKNC